MVLIFKDIEKKVCFMVLINKFGFRMWEKLGIKYVD